MARYRSSRSLRHKGRKHVFGKKAERAIKAISQKPVETKRYYHTLNLLAGASYGAQFERAYNLFSEIPRLLNQVAPDSSTAVMGNKFETKGVKIKLFLSAFPQAPDSVWRITVLSSSEAYVTTAGYVTSWPTNWIDFGSTDPDGLITTTATQFMYNSQIVKILKQKVFMLRQGNPVGAVNTGVTDTTGGTKQSGYRTVSMWVPITGVKTSVQDADEATVGQLKGKQYYLVAEAFSPSGSSLNGLIDVIGYNVVYFKDA